MRCRFSLMPGLSSVSVPRSPVIVIVGLEVSEESPLTRRMFAAKLTTVLTRTLVYQVQMSISYIQESAPGPASGKPMQLCATA